MLSRMCHDLGSVVLSSSMPSPLVVKMGQLSSCLPNDDRAAAVTGLGVVSPLGCTTHDLWSGLCKGASVAGMSDRLIAGKAPVTIACEAGDFDASASMRSKEVRRLDRF